MDKASQIGLLGELWVLWRLIGNLGPAAIKAWTGPQMEQHDFRIEALDIEVKTTLSHSRDHTITGLNQLSMTSTRPISVISVQLKPAGGGPGVSLDQAIKRLSLRLSDDVPELEMFTEGLARLGYRTSDAEHYADEYCLRTAPHVIPVDQDFPVLTTAGVAKAMTPNALQRLRKVLYTVNLDGLGKDIDQSMIDSLAKPEKGDIDA
jgi:hypothetical protein